MVGVANARILFHEAAEEAERLEATVTISPVQSGVLSRLFPFAIDLVGRKGVRRPLARTMPHGADQ